MIITFLLYALHGTFFFSTLLLVSFLSVVFPFFIVSNFILIE